MLTCIDVKFIFDSVHLGSSSSANILQTQCRPPSSLLVVFAMFFAIISPSSSCSSYSWNELSVCHFYFHNQNNWASVPRRCILDVISSLNTDFFQIWSSETGFGELCVCFYPIRIVEYFEWIIIIIQLNSLTPWWNLCNELIPGFWNRASICQSLAPDW